jgi:hypothetical protein
VGVHRQRAHHLQNKKHLIFKTHQHHTPRLSITSLRRTRKTGSEKAREVTVSAGLAKEVTAIAQHPAVYVAQPRRSSSAGWRVDRVAPAGGSSSAGCGGPRWMCLSKNRVARNAPRLKMYLKVWDNNLFVFFRLKAQTFFHLL